jgi:hypothetical protein
MESVKELVKNASTDKVADIQDLESNMMQLVDFCHAATNDPKIESIKVLQSAIRCTRFPTGNS